MTRWRTVTFEDWQKAHAKGKQPIKPGEIATLVDKKPKKQKYNNKIVEVDCIKFKSQFEADYYSKLKLRKRAGEIAGFGRQIHFDLGAGVDYVADFVVWNKDGTAEVIETKGFMTDLAAVKIKFFIEQNPMIKFTVIKKGD